MQPDREEQPGVPAIPCVWGGERNTVLTLHPTEDQWTDAPTVLATAHRLGASPVGAFKVQAPSSSVPQEASSIPPATEHACFRYKLDPDPDLRDIPLSMISRHRHRAIFDLTAPDPFPSHTVSELAAEFEQLLDAPTGLTKVSYRPDIPADDATDRQAVGLSETSLLTSCKGNRLPLKPRVPGVHSPYAYQAAEAFGAPFACHIEDFHLHSLNLLHHGRKVWVIVRPEHRVKLDNAILSTNLLNRPRCEQFVRHASLYIPLGTLDKWGVSYTLIEQKAGEILITLPGAYHQGFSVGATLAEAVNYADDDWTEKGYCACTKAGCGQEAITSLKAPPVLPGRISTRSQQARCESVDSEDQGDGVTHNRTGVTAAAEAGKSATLILGKRRMTQGIVREKATGKPSNGRETREENTADRETATQEVAMLETEGQNTVVKETAGQSIRGSTTAREEFEEEESAVEERTGGKGAERRMRENGKPATRGNFAAKNRKSKAKTTEERPPKRNKRRHKPVSAPLFLSRGRRTVSSSLFHNAAQPDLLRQFVAVIGSPMAVCQLKDLCHQMRQQTLLTPMQMPTTACEIVRNLHVLESQESATAIMQRFHLMFLVQSGRVRQSHSFRRANVNKIPVDKLTAEANPTLAVTRSEIGQPSTE